MLKIVDDSGELVFEFSQSGYFGMIDNAFLMDIAMGKFDKNEARAICLLFSQCKWDNIIEKEIGKGAKMLGVTYKSYADIFNRLIEKKVIIEHEDEYYVNPEYFRRRAFKKKQPFVPWSNRRLLDDQTKYKFDDMGPEEKPDEE